MISGPINGRAKFHLRSNDINAPHSVEQLNDSFLSLFFSSFFPYNIMHSLSSFTSCDIIETKTTHPDFERATAIWEHD